MYWVRPDRNGVLLSEDGGMTFQPSNKGFSARQISAIAQDRTNPNTLYVGVINDKAAGGVLRARTAASTGNSRVVGWVERIYSPWSDAKWHAACRTRHGIYRLSDGNWTNSGLTLALPPERLMRRRSRRPVSAHAQCVRYEGCSLSSVYGLNCVCSYEA